MHFLKTWKPSSAAETPAGTGGVEGQNSGTRCSNTTAVYDALTDGTFGEEKTKEPITDSVVMTEDVFKRVGGQEGGMYLSSLE